jgi:drug/metabolite transporter (DMT)-like permease
VATRREPSRTALLAGAAALAATWACVAVLVHFRTPGVKGLDALWGAAIIAAISLWPLAWHFQGMKQRRRRSDPWARLAAVIGACLVCIGWSAVVLGIDSSTAGLGFIWLPPMVAVAAWLIYLTFRGVPLDPEA